MSASKILKQIKDKEIDYIDLRIYSLIISIGMILSCLAMFFFIKHVFFLLLISLF